MVAEKLNYRAMASLPPMASSSFLIRLVICCFFCLMVDGREHRSEFHAVSLDTVAPELSCSGTNAARRNSMTIVHRFGPCSSTPEYGHHPRRGLAMLVHQDQARVEALHRRMQNVVEGRQLEASEDSLAVSRGISLGSGNYVVTVGIGTPTVDQTIIFDTGSDVCWLQCRPCLRYCYVQQEPIFDPSSSTSYRRVSCNATACMQLSYNGCKAGICLYGVQYGDNSSSIGFLSQDKLTISSTAVFDDFVFGCGQMNNGMFGRTAGLFGLSRNALSVVSQTSDEYGRVFSYCLPVKSSATGSLIFGGAHSTNISYTPMLTDKRAPSLYALELTDISVGGVQLSIPSTAFSTAGTIIDSGTVISRLPPTAYAALRSAFRRKMVAYTPYRPGKPLAGFLDTCYDVAGHSIIKVPKVALHFGGGAVVDLDGLGIVVFLDKAHLCLAFASNREDTSVGIIGNKQQMGREVVYDLARARVGFGTGPCN